MFKIVQLEVMEMRLKPSKPHSKALDLNIYILFLQELIRLCLCYLRK